ncbi:unnamed protein product [Anisakis simplex]|uniref:ABC transmembrane type-1 domain-containing protein n=1 Tax=Anisakis simplex TaxID=6269 RepID=A0A0M3KA83_ANISI|nr:unnamed protein product [Anisakis simplex]
MVEDRETFNPWLVVNTERIKLEKLQAEIALRMQSYRVLPFFMASAVVCTVILACTIALVQVSNLQKNDHHVRKSKERFRKMWIYETTREEASSCIADLDFTYAEARPALICRYAAIQSNETQLPQNSCTEPSVLNSTVSLTAAASTTTVTAAPLSSHTSLQTENQKVKPETKVSHEHVKRLPRWTMHIQILCNGVLLLEAILVGLMSGFVGDSIGLIDEFCQLDMIACQRACYEGRLPEVLRTIAYQLHSDVRNALGVYASHLSDERTNFQYTFVIIYMTCILSCAYILASLWSSVRFGHETAADGRG